MTTNTPITPRNAVSPEQLAVPPPLDLDLIDAGRTVGWIGDNAVGFRGFADEHEAAHAAWLAYRTLARRLARRDGARPVPVGIEPLSLRRIDDREEVLASGMTIATLVRPGPESRSGPDSFGFELRVPAPITELELRSKAHLIYKALRKSGIRWALWRPDATRPKSNTATVAEHASGDSSVGAPGGPGARLAPHDTPGRPSERDRVGSGFLPRWVRRFIPRKSTRTRRAKVRVGVLRASFSREGVS